MLALMSRDISALKPDLEAWARKELKALGDLGVSPRRLAEALAKEIMGLSQADSQGIQHAPDQFNLSLNSDDAGRLAKAWDSLQEALIQGLRSSLEAHGFRVSRRLHLSFSTDPTLDPTQIQVIAWHSGDPLAMEERPVIDLEDAGALPQAFLVVGGQRIFRLETESVAIGRRLDNDLVIDNPRVSRRHALIQGSAGRYLIKDLQSTAGTLVNGRRIRTVALVPGDVIRLAEIELVYGESPGEPPAKAAPYSGPPAGPAGLEHDTTLATTHFDRPTMTDESKRREPPPDQEDQAED
jgi:hypothetical protein